MASRACYTSEQVVAFLDDGEAELDDCFFPGSDDELGFEEIEVAQSEDEDEDTKYDTINMYNILNSLWILLLSDSEGDSIQDDNSDPDGGIFDDVRCVHDYTTMSCCTKYCHNVIFVHYDCECVLVMGKGI